MKKFFLPLLAVAAMASCTETSLETVSPADLAASEAAGGDKVEIKTVAVPEGTRTPYLGTPSEANPFTARVLAWTVPTGGTANYAAKPYINGNVTYTGTGSYGFTTPQYYPKDELSLIGFYPADRWINNGQQITFDGSQDVMVSNQVSAQKAAVGTPQTDPKLQFEHQLTNIVIRVKGVDQRWGKITNIEVVAAGDDENAGVSNTCIYDPVAKKAECKAPSSAGNITSSGDLINDDQVVVSAIKDVNIFKVARNEELGRNVYTDQALQYPITLQPDTENIVGYCMLPPIKFGAPDNQNYWFRFYTTEYKQGVLVKIGSLIGTSVSPTADFTGDTKGHAFGVCFDFSATSLDVDGGTGSVINWDTGVTSSTDVLINGSY